MAIEPLELEREDEMHTTFAYSLALVAFIGKAAVGGAGLALALLGAADLLLGSPTHGWVVVMTTLYLPYFAGLGAAGGALLAFARRRVV